MRYSKQEVMQYVQEEDVKFIRLSFCDVFGRQKNISIMPDELPRAFAYGIAFDGSAIAGFGDETHSDLLLHPEPETLSLLPWRPEHGKVVRMFSTITYPDGRPFEVRHPHAAQAGRLGSGGSRLSLFLRRGAGVLSLPPRRKRQAHQTAATTKPAIWTSPPTTAAKTSAVKSA